MIDWDFLLDENVFTSVLPDEYARFRRPLRGALTTFLQGLPVAHQAAVLDDQAELPMTAAPAERLAVLAGSCPALHKLGQVLARDRRLSAELRRHLQELESLPPSVPVATIRDVLDRELGPLDRLGITLGSAALAEASVAVVIPFRYDQPPRGQGPQDGVFKVLKPGVEERLDQELQLLERVGSYLDERCDDFGLPHLDYQEAFEQVREKLRHEVRLDREQQQVAQARAFYAGDPRVQVPALFDHCTPRVTAMERVTGGKVTGHRLDSWDDRRRLADLVVEALIARPVFADADPAPFHADPHAGNLFLTADQRLGILDWSLVGWLGEPERVAIGQITLAALTLDAERLAALLAGLGGERRVDEAALGAVVRAGLRRVRQGQFPGFTWLTSLLDDAFQTARLRASGDLLLFRKALHTLEGVVADVGAGDGRIDRVLQGEFLRHLAVEWPRRWLARPGSRAFATRLSNADLAGLVLGLPWTVTQFWLDQGFDLLDHLQAATAPRRAAC
jgi:ubiquinone biosynthesis protein